LTRSFSLVLDKLGKLDKLDSIEKELKDMKEEAKGIRSDLSKMTDHE
jgi:hypothetical protein